MILRFILVWTLIINGGSNCETAFGYFSGANHFYQEPASFLGWGSRSEGNESAKSSGKGKGRGSSSGSSQRETSAVPDKHWTKHGKRTTTRSPGEISLAVNISSELEEMIRTGPALVLGGSTIRYVPLAQLATAKPSLFPVGAEMAKELSGSKVHPMETGYPNPMRISGYIPSIPQQAIQPYVPLQQSYFQNPYLLKTNGPLHDQQYQDAEVYVNPKKTWGNLNERKTQYGGDFQIDNLKLSFLHPKTSIESRQTMFLHPRLVSMMRSMDHSLLSYPSRFDYRPSVTTFSSQAYFENKDER